MWILFAALVVLHHDWWFWNDGWLVFGFLPIGLGYQMLISLAASALWGWAAFNAWPDQYDAADCQPSSRQFARPLTNRIRLRNIYAFIRHPKDCFRDCLST